VNDVVDNRVIRNKNEAGLITYSQALPQIFWSKKDITSSMEMNMDHILNRNGYGI